VLKGAVLSGRQPILILSNLYIQIRSGTSNARFVFSSNRDCRAGRFLQAPARLPLKFTLPVLPVRQQIVTSTTSPCLHVPRRDTTRNLRKISVPRHPCKLCAHHEISSQRFVMITRFLPTSVSLLQTSKYLHVISWYYFNARMNCPHLAPWIYSLFARASLPLLDPA